MKKAQGVAFNRMENSNGENGNAIIAERIYEFLSKTYGEDKARNIFQRIVRLKAEKLKRSAKIN